MKIDLQKINIFYSEPNGDTIEEHEFDGVSALIPNVGDKVNIDGTFREVTERAFIFSDISIIVQITLKES